MSASPEARIRRLWTQLSPRPGGKALFSLLLGHAVPYTGSIRPRVEELRSGYARVRLHDRRAVRNHLNSVHAVALMNLAEAATGLALLYGLPDGLRSILTGLTIEYRKKARGTLTAEATVAVPGADFEGEMEVTGELRDEAGDVVAVAVARWTVGKRK